MAKTQAQYQCRECANILPKWSGQCPDCKSWNSIEELPALAAIGKSASNWHGVSGTAGVIALNAVPTTDTPRFSTEIDELDRVLGGGLVRGSVVLLGGDPRHRKIDYFIAVSHSRKPAAKCALRYWRRISAAGQHARAEAQPAR